MRHSGGAHIGHCSRHDPHSGAGMPNQRHAPSQQAGSTLCLSAASDGHAEAWRSGCTVPTPIQREPNPAGSGKMLRGKRWAAHKTRTAWDADVLLDACAGVSHATHAHVGFGLRASALIPGSNEPAGVLDWQRSWWPGQLTSKVPRVRLTGGGSPAGARERPDPDEITKLVTYSCNVYAVRQLLVSHPIAWCVSGCEHGHSQLQPPACTARQQRRCERWPSLPPDSSCRLDGACG